MHLYSDCSIRVSFMMMQLWIPLLGGEMQAAFTFFSIPAYCMNKNCSDILCLIV